MEALTSRIILNWYASSARNTAGSARNTDEIAIDDHDDDEMRGAFRRPSQSRRQWGGGYKVAMSATGA